MVARQIAFGGFELMRPIFALTALAVLAAASPAGAQMYPGEDITVNPSAGGTQVLLYPGGQYGRVVHPLLMPGEENTPPIHLHMPTHRLAHHGAPRSANLAAAEPTLSAPEEAAPLTVPAAPTVKARHKSVHAMLADTEAAAPATTIDTAQPALAEAAPRAPVTKVRRVRPASPPAQIQAAAQPPAPAMGSDISDLEGMAAPPTQQAPVHKPARTEWSPAPTPQRVATAEPPAQRTERAAVMRNTEPTISGNKKSVILFAAGATDPAVTAVQSIKALAGDLSASLTDGSARLQLLAYGGQRGEKSSDARRLSLKRALIIRQLLIDNGVPSERVDVRAMGGVDDNGPADRVDIYLRG
jgi:outer membrane protein OmpA-like peptidoglycan-associated protein